MYGANTIYFRCPVFRLLFVVFEGVSIWFGERSKLQKTLTLFCCLSVLLHVTRTFAFRVFYAQTKEQFFECRGEKTKVRKHKSTTTASFIIFFVLSTFFQTNAIMLRRDINLHSEPCYWYFMLYFHPTNQKLKIRQTATLSRFRVSPSSPLLENTTWHK